MAESVERKQRIFDWYMSHPASDLHEVAEQFEASYETIREWARKESWEIRRTVRTLQENLPDGVIEQANMIRLVLFSKILTVDMEARDLKGLVESWQSLATMTPIARSDDIVDRDAILDVLSES